MDLVIKITIGLFIFSILLIFFKLTKDYQQKNEYQQYQDQKRIESHNPMIHVETSPGDEDLVNNIIWEIENSA